jgi:hypothetical protein
MRHLELIGEATDALWCIFSQGTNEKQRGVGEVLLS